MMSPFSRQDLRVRITKILDQMIKDEETIEPTFIIAHLMNELCVPSDWESEHRLEALFVLREGYRQHVGNVVRARGREADEGDPQHTLPGMQRLQEIYSIVRTSNDGATETEVLVPLAKMTLDEVRAKRAQLVLMRNGLDLHIEELDRYIADRWPPLPTAV
jgi:hypothetical protein